MYAYLSKLILVYNVTVIHVSIVHMYTYSTCVHVYTCIHTCLHVYTVYIHVCSPFAWAFKGAARAIYLIRALCHVTTRNYRVAIGHVRRVQTAYSSTANTQAKVTVGVQDSYTMIVEAVSGLKA